MQHHKLKVDEFGTPSPETSTWPTARTYPAVVKHRRNASSRAACAPCNRLPNDCAEIQDGSHCHRHPPRKLNAPAACTLHAYESRYTCLQPRTELDTFDSYNIVRFLRGEKFVPSNVTQLVDFQGRFSQAGKTVLTNLKKLIFPHGTMQKVSVECKDMQAHASHECYCAARRCLGLSGLCKKRPKNI